jgi:hypothetical protein
MASQDSSRWIVVSGIRALDCSSMTCCPIMLDEASRSSCKQASYQASSRKTLDRRQDTFHNPMIRDQCKMSNSQCTISNKENKSRENVKSPAVGGAGVATRCFEVKKSLTGLLRVPVESSSLF